MLNIRFKRLTNVLYLPIKCVMQYFETRRSLRKIIHLSDIEVVFRIIINKYFLFIKINM